MVNSNDKNITAATIIIGNEILSGRTLDINTQTIASTLFQLGIKLSESRIVPDQAELIIKAVTELSSKYDYIFTTGGIGPTHDDITSKSMAVAFQLEYVQNQEALEILEKFYSNKREEITPPRKRMAYMPEGAKLIYNAISGAPGFIINNVFVMAGIPEIMKSMLDSVLPLLRRGEMIHTKNIDIMIGETIIATEFEALQKKYQQVEMGSYPFRKDGNYGTSLVLKSLDQESLGKAYSELKKILDNVLDITQKF